jgi:MFS family permease
LRAGTFALLAALISIYSLSQFYRSSISVIGPDLAREFSLDAASLGLLGSVFYLSFALAQIPVGLALDHYGARVTIVATGLVAVAGSMLFALAPNFPALASGRLVIGAGCSSFYMGALSVYARRFPPERFAFMAGVQLGVGTLGSLAATSPLAAASAMFGWRATFIGVGSLCLALTLAAIPLLREDRDAANARAAAKETPRALLAGVWAASRVGSFWPLFFIQATTYSAFASIVGLWGGPWLAQVYGLDLDARGNVLFIAVLAQVIGLFAWGWADRFFRAYKPAGLIGVGGSVVALSIAALAPPSSDWLIPLLVFFAFSSAVTPVLTAHGRALFPVQLVGRGLTLLNVGNMGGVFAQQALTGLVVESFGSRVVDGARVYPVEGYRALFGLLAVELFVAALFYARAEDPHPSKAS